MWSQLVAAMALTACVTSTGPDPADPADPDPTDPPGATDPQFQDCRGRAYQAAPTTDWRHDILTPITTAVGDPDHAGIDLVLPTSIGAKLVGKFSYGLVSKDLEDEDVRVSIDDCNGWQSLGDFTTDGDGLISVPLTQSLSIGAHDVMFQVLGDGSTTTSTLWVLPVGTHIVISDIDGTLTTSDTELFQQILDGSSIPEAYAGAKSLTTAHAGRDQIVMYLTGRPRFLMGRTRDWLTGLGFAPGPVRLTDSTSQSLPTEGGVGDFKKSVLEDLEATGYVIDDAYGNATTDIYAYLGAGISAGDIWIVGTHAGEQGSHAATDWTARAGEVATLPLVKQPFTR